MVESTLEKRVSKHLSEKGQARDANPEKSIQHGFARIGSEEARG